MTKKKDDIDKEEIPEGFHKFQKAITGTSTDVLKLLNVHLLTEYYLEQIILSVLSRGDRLLDDRGVQYSFKLKIVESMDVLPDNLVTALKQMNKLRNSISHEMEYSVSEADIDRVGRSFGKDYTKYKKQYPEEILETTLMMITARLDQAYRDLIDYDSEPVEE